MTERITKCSCGKLYEFHSMYVGDQSRCPHCRSEMREQLEKDRQSNKTSKLLP